MAIGNTAIIALSCNSHSVLKYLIFNIQLLQNNEIMHISTQLQ